MSASSYLICMITYLHHTRLSCIHSLFVRKAKSTTATFGMHPFSLFRCYFPSFSSLWNEFPSILTAPVGPMQYTDRIFPERIVLVNTANVVSVKIVSSDYGYPLHVYGTIIARDSLDHKCIYMFRRGKDDCQLISSKVILLSFALYNVKWTSREIICQQYCSCISNFSY
jgi:hypothetical protein